MPAPGGKRSHVRRERKLPVQQLAILAVCRFAEPIASTSLFPYLPEMVHSFSIPEDQIGKWAGLCSAIFSLCQATMGIPWGRFSDRYGRKPAILLGLACTMLTSLLWGFSTSLPMAIVARALAGAGNGNIGIIRTTVAEMVPFKELQPRAFSIMPLVWNVGSIFGPTIGGALANPFNVRSGEKLENPSLLQRFPYALPNLVAACFFAVGIAVGILFLEETLETLQGRRDYGLRLGDKLKAAVRRHISTLRNVFRPRHFNRKTDAEGGGERTPLLKPAVEEDAGHQPVGQSEQHHAAPSWREVLNKQAAMNLLVYTLLALHNMGFDQLIPVYMQYPPLQPRDPSNSGGGGGNPLKFAGGFGLTHVQIGLISTVYGVCGMLIQFFLFPPIARRLGVLNCLKACACTFPLAYLAVPFTALLPSTAAQVAACFAVMMLKCVCGIFAFPCSTILLTNSASSLRVLGTLNGFATSFSALGRAAGPAIGGAMFTLGVQRGYVIAPWWLFAALAIVAAVPVFFLVEGEGFGGDDEGGVSDVEEEAEEVGEAEDEAIESERDQMGDDGLMVEALEGEAEAAGGKAGPVLHPTPEQLQEREEEEYGGMGPLTRETSLSSALSLGSDEYSTPGVSRVASRSDGRQPSESMDPLDRAFGVPLPGMGPSGRGRGRGQSGSVFRDPPDVGGGSSNRIVRKSSTPIGMGSRGISRRYSGNLGQSLGSAGSYHG